MAECRGYIVYLVVDINKPYQQFSAVHRRDVPDMKIDKANIFLYHASSFVHLLYIIT